MSSGVSSVCAIKGCVNKKPQKQRKHLFFYRFPKSKAVVTKWLLAGNRSDLMDLLETQDPCYFYRKRYLMCSDHFERKYFRNEHVLSKGLIKSAVPTKNLVYDNISKRCSENVFEMDDVKIKVEQTCQGCLSTDRRTAPLGYLNEILFNLIPTVTKDTILFLCWECVASLKRLYRFKKQVLNAQEILKRQKSNRISLSTLTTYKKDYYDNDIIYTDDEMINIKEENIESTEVNEVKTNYVELDVNADTNDNCEAMDQNERDETPDTNVKMKRTEDDTNDNCETAMEDLNERDETSYTNVKIKRTEDDANDNCETATDQNERDETSTNVKLKRRKKSKFWKSTKQEYKKYANLICQNWQKPYSQYFEKVELDEEEIEVYFLRSDRKRQGYKMQLECKKCSLSYARQIDLDRHNNLNHHEPHTEHKCLHCDESQPSMDRLRVHWRAHSVFYKCVLCSACVFPCSIALHLSRSHVNLYSCTGCKLSFSTLVLFSEHYNKNHPFVCNYCNKKCALRSVLEKHIKNHHTPQSCLPCGKHFDSYRLYRSHCREIHPELLNIGVEPEQCYCVECDQQFPSVALYKKHINSKHTQKPPKLKRLPCPECGKAFTKNSDMLLHYNFAHVKITKFHCDLCDKYFLKMYGLRTHMERVHLKLQKPKDKICDLCGRAFQSNSVLDNHRRTHTGERPFKCGTCPAAFAQKGAMRIHQRKQHAT